MMRTQQTKGKITDTRKLLLSGIAVGLVLVLGVGAATGLGIANTAYACNGVDHPGHPNHSHDGGTTMSSSSLTDNSFLSLLGI